MLTGDRPITHLADDGRVFGGFLMGVVLSSGGAGLWAHDFSDLNATFSGGAVRWSARDARLPGIELSAAVFATATGVGFVLDANVTRAAGAPDAEVVWAWGCGAQAKGQKVGWQKDPLINADVLAWDFSPGDCAMNSVAMGADNASVTTTFSGGSVGMSVATTAPARALTTADALEWRNVTELGGGGGGGGAPPAAPAAAAALPLPGATLWLRAASLAPALPSGGAVSAWADESGGGAVFTQGDARAQPAFLIDGLGAGQPGVRFDGAGTFLEAGTPDAGAEATMLAVIKDEGSTSDCCSGALFFNGTFHGISTLVAHAAADDDDAGGGGAPAIVTTLDFPGSAAYGHSNIRGRLVVAAAVYSATGPSFSMVDQCAQGSAALGAVPSSGPGALLGRRAFDVPRFFKGQLGEVVVFPRALNASELAAMRAYFAAAWPALAPKRTCAPKAGPLAVGRSPLLPAGGAPTRFTWAALGDGAPPAAPDAALAAAQARAARLAARATSATPDALLDAALPALSFAVDGLYRQDPGAFVHGAMAWDDLYLGWRSEYGATVFGAPELVASEGRYFVGKQILESPNARCHSNPDHRFMDEAPDSRFHGKGRIDAAGSIYDMQSQFFDQQIHMWRWTGDASHEALLRPALKLHAEWAADCFDGDGNGLYSSYTNTWPTDSQFYSGGETYEETAYMYRVHLALRDMAARAGNASEAAAFAAAAARIRGAAAALWVGDLGLPASHREEGGHRRLRPDPWLYSVFLPVEAGLWDAETAAQALFFTEHGLQRDAVQCDAVSNATCGALVWTSNWVPDMWSVRQLWAGDIFGLALAYFLAGLPDDGANVLGGALRWNMLQSAVPGQAGGTNGGTDFNDCVHPAARAVVEGLFGYRPDYGAHVVEVAPQLPSSWPAATFYTAGGVALSFSTDFSATATLTVRLATPAPTLLLRLPLRAGALLGVTVSGAPPGASLSNVTEAGFGQSVVVVVVADAAGVGGATVTLSFSGALPCMPSVAANATAGAPLTLSPPPGLALVNFSDPQGVFVPGSARLVGGRLTGAVSGALAAPSSHLVMGYATTSAGGLPQIILFKLAVAAAPGAPPPLRGAPPPAGARVGADFSFVPLGAAANGDLRDIFKDGAYTSPRPETCAVRMGSDGWSGWTFAYWNGPLAPQADFSNVPNLTVAPGPVIATPQGARFFLGNVSAPPQRNAAFATLWDAYPNVTAVPVGDGAGAAGAWVLLAGSTSPMQTKLANGELRFRFADGGVARVELVPPVNYWALSGWGSADYDYGRAAFCLPPTPPATVQLGAHNRAMVYHMALAGRELIAVELEVLSQEVVMALLAVSLER